MDMSIASVLCDAMDKASMNQKELAEQVGITQSYVSQICAGKKTPTIATLNRMSECLQIPLLSFFEEESAGKTKGKTESPGGRMRLSEEERRLVRFYRKMDSKGRAMINGIVSSM